MKNIEINKYKIEEFMMKPEVKQYLNTNNFDALYELFYDEFYNYYVRVSLLTQILYTAGIDPLPYFKDKVPSDFMSSCYNYIIPGMILKPLSSKTIVIPDNIKIIGSGAFAYMDIETIICTKVESLDEYCFGFMKNLKSIYLSQDFDSASSGSLQGTGGVNVYIDQDKKSLHTMYHNMSSGVALAFGGYRNDIKVFYKENNDWKLYEDD